MLLHTEMAAYMEAHARFLARFSVTGLNAATKYDGDMIATFASAATIVTILSRKNDLLRHDKMAHAAIAISMRPIIGTSAVDRCDAAIIARSSASLNSSFGRSPCHNQMI